jgi:hypothetical protein
MPPGWSARPYDPSPAGIGSWPSRTGSVRARWWTTSEWAGARVYELRDGASGPARMTSAYDNSLSVIIRVGPHSVDHASPGTVVPET